MVFLPNQVIPCFLLSPLLCLPPAVVAHPVNGMVVGENCSLHRECQATFGTWQTKLALSGGVFGSITVPKITLSNFLDMYVKLITLVAS